MLLIKLKPKYAFLCLVFSFAVAMSQETIPAKQNNKQTIKENMAWQIALETKMFTTGSVDGVWGPKSDKTLIEYIKSEGLEITKNPKESEEVQKLLQVDFENAFTEYVITAEDKTQVGVVPEDWNERSKLPSMCYEYLYELVQGKFHCSKKALIRLNPNIVPEEYVVGTKLVVPNIKQVTYQKMKFIEINLLEKTISGYDANDKKVLFMYCSVAQNKEKLPNRDAVVQTKALNPNYTFNPKYWPEVKNVTQVLIIKPGPKNPVGMAWMGLDLPGYGIHGTPLPDNIGKTGSHGCFRLTNWHAIQLFHCLDVGTPVKMIGASKSESEKILETADPAEEENLNKEMETPILKGDLRKKTQTE